jgi:3-hydroxybutyryl-CoA dehydrogenase
MHFFNPAVLMPLVEVVAGQASSSTAIDKAVEAARRWGKTPVRVKDTPGFIVNRVARAFYLEALRLLGEGVAGIDEIDLVMKRLGGFKMGPFELMDLIGIDVNYSVTVSVWEQMGRAARFAPHEIQRSLVEAGHLGRKTGRGFYKYDGDRALPAYPVGRKSFQVSPLLGDAVMAFTARAGVIEAGTTERLVLARILSAIMNEAGHALSEQIATLEDIDIAMVKGTSYPKGPLAWADEIGPRTVRGLLKALNQAAGDGRYESAKVFAEAH